MASAQRVDHVGVTSVEVNETSAKQQLLYSQSQLAHFHYLHVRVFFPLPEGGFIVEAAWRLFLFLTIFISDYCFSWLFFISDYFYS
jgi:hypothetical protein